MEKGKVKDNKHLQKDIDTIMKEVLEGVLDFSEVAVGDSGRYAALRSKILKLVNNGIRQLQKNVNNNYEVIFTGVDTTINYDVVKVSPGKE